MKAPDVFACGGQDGVLRGHGEHDGVPPFRPWTGRSSTWTPPCDVHLDSVCMFFPVLCNVLSRFLYASRRIPIPYVLSGSRILDAYLDAWSRFSPFRPVHVYAGDGMFFVEGTLVTLTAAD